MIEIDKKRIRIWSMLGMARTFGSIMEDLYCEDNRFVLSVADTGRMLAYESFYHKHPKHVMEMGIAEQNMVAASAGAVSEGYSVFASSYSTFVIARALDQIRVNMGIMQLPLKLIGIGGGLADGTLSATHMGIEDIADIRCIPGVTVIVPADGMEFVKTMFALLDYDRPVYVKLTGENSSPVIYKEDYNFEIGKAIELRDGCDVAIVANGVILEEVQKAANILGEDEIDCKVINMHTICPLDENMLQELADIPLLVTVEEHNVKGGLGSAIAEWYADKSVRPRHIMIGIDGDTFPKANEYKSLIKLCGLDADSIANRIKNILNNSKS